jgi:predicted ribosomally synthesized peptide with SipW-like signal peptide
MSKKRVKQYLMLLCVIGLVSIAAGSGTFASFSAETTNPNNTFAAGTLYLHNTPNGGTTCTSESATTGPNFNVNPGDGTNGNNCSALFTADLSQGAMTATIALNDAGSLASTDLKLAVPSCSWSDNFASTGTHSTFISVPANCNGVYFTVQETGSSYVVPTSDVYCALGPSAAPHTDCGAPSSSQTLGGTSAFTQLLTAGGANATLGAGATRYYVIKVDPSGVGTGNALQNLKLTFAMSFHIDH